jgi:hypothetical protein
MNRCFAEPTIDELLGDSLTQTLMQADRVDAHTLRAMLNDVAFCRTGPIVLQNDQIKGRSDPSWIPNVWPAERSHRSWAAAASST